MSIGSSSPVQLLQGSSKGKLLGEGRASLDDAGLARAAVFAPFTGNDLERTATLRWHGARERDWLRMEHLPRVRYWPGSLPTGMAERGELSDRFRASCGG